MTTYPADALSAAAGEFWVIFGSHPVKLLAAVQHKML